MSPRIFIPRKQKEKEKLKIACLNVQGLNDPAKRECVGRLFEERGLDVLVMSETKLRGKGERSFGAGVVCYSLVVPSGKRTAKSQCGKMYAGTRRPLRVESSKGALRARLFGNGVVRE